MTFSLSGGLTQAEMPSAVREDFGSEVEAFLRGDGSRNGDSEFLEFYSLISRPRKLLALVRQTRSSEGGELAASPLLEAVLDAYRQKGAAERLDGCCGLPVERAYDVIASAPVFTHGRRDLRLRRTRELPRMRNVPHATVDPDLAADAGDRVISATEIETYVRCPYRWFYSHVVKPDDVDSQVDAAMLGSYSHRLIAAFYSALIAGGEARVTRENLLDALALFDQTADRLEDECASPVTIGEEIDAARARRWARAVVETDAVWLPHYAPVEHEMGFGQDGAFEFGGASLAGRIDRIDAGEAGIVVTDYKSSRDVSKLVRADSRGGIQHVVYARAAEQLLGRPVVGSGYRSLRTGQIRGFWRGDLLGRVPEGAPERDVVDAPQYQELVARVEQLVADAVDGIRAGRIPRQPQSPTECRYCALARLCEGART